MSEKAKTAKNVLEKKDFAPDIPIASILSYSFFPHVNIFTSEKAKNGPLHYHLLKYL